jgi:hypothetical protein
MRIPQPALSSREWHARIMARFLRSLDSASRRAQSGFPPLTPTFSPTRFHEEPLFFVTDLIGPRNVAIRRRSGTPAAVGLLARHFCRDVAAIGASP